MLDKCESGRATLLVAIRVRVAIVSALMVVMTAAAGSAFVASAHASTIRTSKVSVAASVEVGGAIVLTLSPASRLRTSTALVEEAVGHAWRVRASKRISKRATLSFKAPAAAQRVTLRAELLHGKRVVWRSGSLRVTVKTAPASTAAAAPGPASSTKTGTTTPAASGSPAATAATAPPSPNLGSTLAPNQTLSPGQYLQSPNGDFQLIMQGDGNLVLYSGPVTCSTSCTGDALWNSGTGGDDGAAATMQSDGNLVIYDNGAAVWSSGTGGFAGADLKLQDDDNLVVYQGSDPVWDWSSGYIGNDLGEGETLSAGEELISPGGQYQLIMQGDGNLVLYSGEVTCSTSCSGNYLWDSGTAGDDGAAVTMQGDGNLVIYDNGTAVWSSSTGGFSGASLRLQNDDNLVIYQGSDPIWDWGAGYLGNQLLPGETLTAGEQLMAPGHQYSLIMQGDGNLVLYSGAVSCSTSCSGSYLWQSGTAGDDGADVTMQSDGNLVIYDDGTAKWNSGTAGHSGSELTLQDDHNLVIYQGATAIWDWENGDLSSSGGAGAGNAGQAIVAAAQSIEHQANPEEPFSSSTYTYCFDGGTASGASPGRADPDTDGSYSNCNSIGRTGFDCRGLALYAVYQGTGGAVNMTSESSTAQTQYADAASYGGSQISDNSVHPGDLVFFGSSASDIDHVGIVASGTGGSAEIVSAVSENYGIRTETISWFQAEFKWVGAVAIPGA